MPRRRLHLAALLVAATGYYYGAATLFQHSSTSFQAASLRLIRQYQATMAMPPPPVPKRVRYCDPDAEASDGAWVPISPSDDPCAHVTHRNCWIANETAASIVQASTAWSWQPHRCRLRPFNMSYVQKWLSSPADDNEGGLSKGSKSVRRIWYVGDSLQTDMSNSLRCLLGEGKHGEYRRENIIDIRADRFGCTKNKNCDNATEMLSFWEGMLGGGRHGADDILVLNTGAHWYGRPEDAAGAFRLIAAAISSVFRGAAVVFRTTVMGHEGCQDRLGPLSDDGTTASEPTLYNWKDFGRLNGLVDEAFRASSLRGRYHLLNVSMFEVRGDGHVGHHLGGDAPDCLHYCVPGPLRWWNYLLVHLLLEKGVWS